ncbi:hypothetical protein TWF192_006903 [Orbilia oligospora]|uniref:Uncharacterized protein n=1 Tax=Orbilia oligospora TaxID=2813651 RepID=A0A6G1M7Z4_ORBOL|nr:hypothetical protein TWF191_010557 [Orbilia oligospora]KAF3246389.1 hypothetical protein TWF192_006903 [Orbilia oligospora]
MSAKSTGARINYKGETAAVDAQEIYGAVKAAPENSEKEHRRNSGDNTVQGNIDVDMDLDDVDYIEEIGTDLNLEGFEDYGSEYYDDQYKGLTGEEIVEKWENDRLMYLARGMETYGWRDSIDVDVGIYVPSKYPAWPEYQRARGLMRSELELEKEEQVEMYTSMYADEEDELLQPEPMYYVLENSPNVSVPIATSAGWVHKHNPTWKQDLNLDTTTSSSPVTDGRPQGPTDAKGAIPDFNRKFLTGSLRALNKLRHASKDPTASPQLRAFVESLGDLKDIIQTGLASLQSIFNNKVPSRLKDIYCLLHVAYAISRVEKNAKDPDLPSKAFRQDLYVFRGCLPSQPESPDEILSPQDLFDEIIGIMWKEFEEGLKWVIPRLSKETSSFFDQRVAQTRAEVQTTRPNYRPNGIYMTFPKTSAAPEKHGDVPKPLDIVTGSGNAPEIDNDLMRIQRVVGTMVYKEFVKTLSQLCHQQFAYLCWSGAIDGLLFWTESPDLLDLILADNNAKGCMYCGNPYNLEGDCAPCKYLKTSLSTPQANGYLWLYNQVVTAASISRIMDLTVSGLLETPSPEPSDGELFQELIDLAPDSTLTFNPQPEMRRPRIGDTRSTNFRCPEPDCSHEFARKQGLDRHIAQFHSPETVRTKIICGYRGCSAKRSQIVSATRGTRNDNMRTHMRTQHRFTEEQLRKWKARYRGDEEVWEFE